MSLCETRDTEITDENYSTHNMVGLSGPAASWGIIFLTTIVDRRAEVAGLRCLILITGTNILVTDATAGFTFIALSS